MIRVNGASIKSVKMISSQKLKFPTCNVFHLRHARARQVYFTHSGGLYPTTGIHLISLSLSPPPFSVWGLCPCCGGLSRKGIRYTYPCSPLQQVCNNEIKPIAVSYGCPLIGILDIAV